MDKVTKGVGRRPPPKGGSRKGIPNKVTASIKEMVEGALQDVGGREYLAQQARENPGPFIALVGKLIPKDVTVSGGVDVKVAASEAVQKVMDSLFKPPGGEK